jgi:uncharacterized protein (DUF2062 family)
MIKLWRKRWFRRQRNFKRSMHGGRLHTLLGRHFFHRQVWRSDKRGIAGGLATGLFMAFTPTIPFQMLLAAAASIYFRVNLPVALAACWVTNPFTVVPIYMAARRIGNALLTHNEHVESFINLFVSTGHIGSFVRGSIHLTSGLLILATLAAGCGYLAVHLLWAIVAWLAPVRKKQPLPRASATQKTLMKDEPR